jgi:hypothetical protein
VQTVTYFIFSLNFWSKGLWSHYGTWTWLLTLMGGFGITQYFKHIMHVKSVTSHSSHTSLVHSTANCSKFCNFLQIHEMVEFGPEFQSLRKRSNLRGQWSAFWRCELDLAGSRVSSYRLLFTQPWQFELYYGQGISWLPEWLLGFRKDPALSEDVQLVISWLARSNAKGTTQRIRALKEDEIDSEEKTNRRSGASFRSVVCFQKFLNFGN